MQVVFFVEFQIEYVVVWLVMLGQCVCFVGVDGMDYFEFVRVQGLGKDVIEGGVVVDDEQGVCRYGGG